MVINYFIQGSLRKTALKQNSSIQYRAHSMEGDDAKDD